MVSFRLTSTRHSPAPTPPLPRAAFRRPASCSRHLSANDAAADIEQIRQALGQDDGLVAYAGSYGTLYATAYLEQYGDHVKALVLDGVVDHSVDLATYGVRWALSTEDALLPLRGVV